MSICRFALLSAAGVLFITPALAWAQQAESSLIQLPDQWDSSWHSYWETKYRQSFSEEVPLMFRGRLWGEGAATGEFLKLFASGYVESDLSVTGRDSDEDLASAELSEAHITVDTSWLDIIVGQQYIRWGSANRLSTIDIVNPTNYRDPIATARSSNRLATPSIDFNINLGSTLIDFIVVPDPRFSEIPVAGSPWETSDLKELRTLERQGFITLREEDLNENPEWGIKLHLFRHRYDLSFIFYDGYEHNPFYVQFNDKDTGQTVVESTHKRYQAYSINFVTTFEEATLRFEGTLKKDYPFQSDDLEIITDDRLQFILGWEQTFGINMLCDMQLFSSSRLSSKEIPGVSKDEYGVTASLQDKFFDEELTSGVRGIWYTSEHEFILEQYNTYDYDDHWKFAFGLFLIKDHEGGYLEGFEENSNIYIQCKYVF